MTGNKRSGELDLLRMVFILEVVLYHFKTGTFPYRIGVEFFFVLSGLLMARHAEKRVISTEEGGSRDLGLEADETWSFMRGKIRSFYKYYLIAFVIRVFVRSIIVNRLSVATIVMRLLKSIPTLTLTFFGINGVSTANYINSTWFLSAMLIAMFILYPILLRNHRFAVKIVFPILTLFILGYEYTTNQTIGENNAWTGLTYFGILRAVSELAFGGTLYYISTEITGNAAFMKRAQRPLNRTLLTLCKVICYIIPLMYAHKYVFGHKFAENFDLHALLILGIGILLSYSGLGWSVPDSKLTRYLGKITLPIFIYHTTIKVIWQEWMDIEEFSPKYNWFVLVVSLIVSVMLMYLTDWIARGVQKLRTRRQEQLSA